MQALLVDLVLLHLFSGASFELPHVFPLDMFFKAVCECFKHDAAEVSDSPPVSERNQRSWLLNGVFWRVMSEFGAFYASHDVFCDCSALSFRFLHILA